jgi:hypothetical protein
MHFVSEAWVSLLQGGSAHIGGGYPGRKKYTSSLKKATNISIIANHWTLC